MKKIILLSITTFICISLNSMEMDVEDNANKNNSNNPSKVKNNNSLEQLLKQNLEATRTTNILLRAILLQNKTEIEYWDNVKHDTRQSRDQHAKEAQKTFDNVYKSTNAQLKDKTLHIPMTGQTTIATTKDHKNTEDTI